MRPRANAAALAASLLAALLAASSLAAAPAPPAPARTCPGYASCPPADFTQLLPADVQAREFLARIDASEQDALRRFGARQIFADLVATLGEAIFFDRHLSVNANQPCAFCHDPRAGFRGGLDVVNAQGGIFPGSVRSRIGFRVPKSAAYAAFAPTLHYDAAHRRFVGGNFWDGRATGLTQGSPAVEQAMEPFTNPLEMALPDSACAVHRVAISPYGAMFAQIWGPAVQSIKWPANTAQLCATAADGPPRPRLGLNPAARSAADLAFSQIASSIVSYELSTHSSLFSSKFDAWQAGRAELSGAEARGYALFTGRAHCAACHAATGNRPLFTNYAFYALDLPPAPNQAYRLQSVPDVQGFIANPAGEGFADLGLAGTLARASDPAWRKMAAQYRHAFATPSLRNIAAREQRGLRAVYMHDGSIGTLRDAVHVFVARGLPQAAARAAGIAPGPLAITAAEEADIIAFLGTLTDGYYAPGFTPRSAVP